MPDQLDATGPDNVSRPAMAAFHFKGLTMLPKLIGSVAVVALCLAMVAADEIKGKVTITDANKNTITVTANGKDQTFTVSKNAKIYTTGEGKKGKPDPKIALTMGTVKTGSMVTVTTEKQGDKDVVTSLKVDNIYKRALVYVNGDTKQAFIHNKITTREQADNLLKGFHAMKVNGIRIPIFAAGATPNHAIYDYFVRQAQAQGFHLFANPALFHGGKRIANGVLGEKDAKLKSVLNKQEKAAALIKRIKQFSAEYKCKWIDPFNEDGKPGATWSKHQISKIYNSLKNELNGAELVGPCTHHISAGIAVLEKTDIRKHVTIATTHNLGFEHRLWPKFIAHAGRLPVWDSEATHNNKDGKGSRLVAAIENGVQGVVLYNSYVTINLSNGSLDGNAKALQAAFLK